MYLLEPQPDQREGTPLSPNAAITQSQTPRGITPQPTSALVDNFTPRDVTSTVREAQNNRPLSTTPQPTAIRTHSAPRDFTNTVRETRHDRPRRFTVITMTRRQLRSLAAAQIRNLRRRIETSRLLRSEIRDEIRRLQELQNNEAQPSGHNTEQNND